MGGRFPAVQGGWLRAAGLLAGATFLWVGSPVVLVGVPFLLLAIFRPLRRPLAWVLVGLTSAAVALGNTASGFWYVERGWALLLGGCFLALSLRWPGGRFLPKGLGAVLGAFLGTALFYRVRPQDWRAAEWLVTERMESAMTAALRSIRMNVAPPGIPVEMENQVAQLMAVQELVFPALLGLASLSALGLAWWLHHTMARRAGDAIRPLKEFRFNDQLVWLFILGFVALVATSGALERVGVNTVVFMGGLYALRGTAVLLFLAGGVSVLGSLLFLVGFVLLAPFFLMAMVFIGLGDTWFDLRNRRPSPKPGT